MLGYLLASTGVAVTVLEKHGDFFRDFRGDTVHPSTLELMHELGLLQDFLLVPHQELTKVGGVFGNFSFTVADFRHVPTHCKFVALMPQWEFLDFLSTRAQKHSSFTLLMEHEAVDLMRENLMETVTQIGTESLRYSCDIPGQALAYKMGALEITRLREKARAELGPRFDIRRFHEAVLGRGSLPMTTLARHVDWFIAQEKQR